MEQLTSGYEAVWQIINQMLNVSNLLILGTNELTFDLLHSGHEWIIASNFAYGRTNASLVMEAVWQIMLTKCYECNINWSWKPFGE